MSSTRPPVSACWALNTRPSTICAFISAVRFGRRSRTRPTKRCCMSPMSDSSTWRSAGVIVRSGEPMSFIEPETMVWLRTPILSKSPCTLTLVKTTPMLPVTVVGLATIVSPARAA